MLLFNFLFIIGLPSAIYQVIRSHLGGSTFNKDFVGLDKANSKAKSKKYQKAFAIYATIEKRLGHCAGVRYNHALALSHAGQNDEAIAMLNESLKDCSNYLPSATLLQSFLASGNQAEQAAELAMKFAKY
ncbi:MAG: hypothetical protein HZA50_05095 [Planctomycetes bacterium]|nr:hypothetical protein [Planctomycetota bacterium]